MDNSRLREKLGKQTFTYTVTSLWPDGDLLQTEHRTDRDSAFDEASEMVAKHDCEVLVERIDRNQYGLAMHIEDVTEEFCEERAIYENH